jgi:hypothetical protein
VASYAQTRIEPNLLTFKKTLADQQQAAVAAPFAGLRTPDGKVDGLYPIRATGVSTEPLRAAADAFIATHRVTASRGAVWYSPSSTTGARP